MASSGGKPRATQTKCVTCNGKGLTQVNQRISSTQIGVSRVICPDCNGEGARLREKDRCKKCKGKKTVFEHKKIEFMISRGMENQARITLVGQGDQEPGRETGDIVFVLKTKTHRTFQRSGADLLVTAHLTLSEALTGFNRVIFTHLDGRGVRLSSPPNTVVRSGDAVRIANEGMPHAQGSGRGDMYVIYEVDMPDEEWLRGIDTAALARLLPPKRPDLAATTVTDVTYEAADITNFGGNDAGSEDEAVGSGGPECQHQ
ncbi:DnaJ domain protein [Ceratobasidium sp. AG-Ba]|nr:DnaJ domain protein [Ceratobasidium sp. AG-Ba]QRW04005.1 DnaJ domain protein [Ceratobasidium sp. AG-Ba]